MTGMTAQLGRVLGGRYRLTAPIGTGASAQVFLAEDSVLRRRVAVKILHPALAADESFLRRFRAEARAAAALSHPNVMAVYDWGEDDGPYLVLEYLGGGSLRAMLDRGHRLSNAQAVQIGLEAARALEAAHRRDYVHRDIKPANLLFGEDGRLRIADFGLARALSEAAWTDPGDIMGTPRYAAPEQASAPRIDGKADVYSLGLVLIEAVTGHVPLTADTPFGTIMVRTHQAVPVPEDLGPLRPALEGAGRPDPRERFSAAQMAHALLAAAHHLDAPPPLPLLTSPVTPDADADPTVLPTSRTAPVENDEPTRLVQPVDVADPRPGSALFDDLAFDTAGDAVGADEDDDDDALDPTVPPGPPRRRRRRRRWPWVLLALIVLASLGAGGAYLWLEAQPAQAAVPFVDGETLEAARILLDEAQAEADEGAGLQWVVTPDYQYSDGIASGLVISQDPASGVELEDGGTVTLMVSLGPPPRDVPNLAGMNEEQVVAALTAADLVLGLTSTLPSEDVASGVVLGWSAAGVDRPATVPKGTAVDVVFSSGPEPRVIPSYVGVPFDQAKAELEAKGLVVVPEERFSTELDAGLVIESSPPADAVVNRGDTVTLIVSKGRDLVTVPEVIGLSLEQAVAALVAAGLQPGEVFGPAQGLPDSTDPVVGTQVDRGTVVDVYLKR